jgi:hypothetical protein
MKGNTMQEEEDLFTPSKRVEGVTKAEKQQLNPLTDDQRENMIANRQKTARVKLKHSNRIKEPVDLNTKVAMSKPTINFELLAEKLVKSKNPDSSIEESLKKMVIHAVNNNQFREASVLIKALKKLTDK